MECTSWSHPSPGSCWQNPPPPAELLKAAADQPAFLSLHVPRWFLFVFQLVMGGSPFWGVSRKTPKMPVPTPEAPSGLPSNSLQAAPDGLIAEEGVWEACKLEWVPQDGISF